MLATEYARSALQIGLQLEGKIGINPFKFGMIAGTDSHTSLATTREENFFGGWDYAPEDVFRSNAVEVGYDKGVPMGGDLTAAPSDTNGPVFMVGAMKDPWSGNLDRVQIIKGWVDEKGERHERIYDVAVSDGRSIGPDGLVTEPVGNTVNLEDASFVNSIGDSELRALWQDPDFDPKQRAVYYARVLEIPTPTWQAHDAAFYGVDMPEEVPMMHQERAYTSPIWYTP